MKKPNVLNRSMFNRGGTSAYGRGITSNLVSDEQRQGYNYGGRVRAAHGLPHYRSYTDRGQQYVTDYIPQSQEDWRKLQEIQMEGLPYKTIEEINQEVESSGLGEKPWYKIGSDWPGFGETTEDYTSRIAWEKSPEAKAAKRKELLQERQTAIGDLETLNPDLIEKRKEVGLYTPGISAEQPLHQEFGTPVVEEEEEKVVVEEPGYERGEHWEDLASKMPGKELPGKEEPTDILDVDRWAFLDENIAKKKKLARGQAAWEGAATALDWGFAGTPEAQAAAVSKGLRKVGGIGAKYKGEAEDLKTKAQILGAVEDIKGERKEKQFEKQQEGYYKPLLDIRTKELELKQDIQERALEDEDPKDIYAAIRMPKPGDILTPDRHQFLIQELTGVTLTIEDDKNSKDLRDPAKNDQVIFIDKSGKIKKNNKGNIIDWDPRKDPNFTWKKP